MSALQSTQAGPTRPQGGIGISGGASGMGLALARRLVEQGGPVALFDVASGPLEAAADELASGPGPAFTYWVDTADEAAVEAAMAEAETAMGGIAGAVAAAGVRQTATPVLDLSLEEWERIFCEGSWRDAGVPMGLTPTTSHWYRSWWLHTMRRRRLAPR